MIKISIGVAIVAALVTVSSLVWSLPVVAKDNTGAIVGLIAGAVVGAAVASSVKHPTKLYIDKPKRNDWNRSFSPKPGVHCYPAQQACYHKDGSYAASQTAKVFY